MPRKRRGFFSQPSNARMKASTRRLPALANEAEVLHRSAADAAQFVLQLVPTPTTGVTQGCDDSRVWQSEPRQAADYSSLSLQCGKGEAHCHMFFGVR